MAKRGKRYRGALAQVDRNRAYPPHEAVQLAKQVAPANFDETVELHFRTGLDPRHADQQLRGTVLLPHGLGRVLKVLVLTEGEGIRIAQEAGADYVGSDDLIQRIAEGWLDFDRTLATRDVMTKVSRLGRILGPRGLMPNPRTGTVVEVADLPQAIRDARQGRVEYRLDRTALLHLPIGKVSFEEDKLMENMATVVEAVVRARPTGVKGQYIRAASLCTTMGPGIKLELQPTLALTTV